MRVFVRAGLWIGLAALPGCGNSLAPRGALSGTWIAHGSIYTYDMDLTQVGDTVTGGGMLHTQFSPPDLILTVEGKFRGSMANLTFHYGTVTTQFTGQLRLFGVLSGSETRPGGTFDSLTFKRRE